MRRIGGKWNFFDGTPTKRRANKPKRRVPVQQARKNIVIMQHNNRLPLLLCNCYVILM